VVRKSPLTPEAASLLREIEARRKARSRARIARMLAKKRGDLRKMPLSGKAAMAAIKAGTW
jgi:hypothetical protein